MAPVATPESTYLGDLVIYETEHQFNRAVVMLAAGQDLLIGAVVGKDDDDEYGEYDPGASDGREDLDNIAILLKTTDATDAAVKTLILEDGPAIVVKDLLVWKSGLTDNQKATALAGLKARGIKARAGA